MYPEDRVLVGVMPSPRDFELARAEHWYRVPREHAPKGIHAEYVAFYFTKAFGEDLRWAIHFYARRTGHELVRRYDLVPGEPDHPRADELYYKLQLGPIRQRKPPIVSLRWRRVTFIHTTWDRFVSASEINDLFSTDDVFVDRLYHTLKERGLYTQRQMMVRERGADYLVDLVIPCRKGDVLVTAGEQRPGRALALVRHLATDVENIQLAVRRRGGPLLIDVPLDA
jgi:hypothetical protein